MSVAYGTIKRDIYRSPYISNTEIEVLPIDEVFTPSPKVSDGFGDTLYSLVRTGASISIRQEGGATEELVNNTTSGATYIVTAGTYELIYSFRSERTINIAAPGSVPETHITTYRNTVVYTFAVINNYLPLKKYTVTDVLNRLFDVAEPRIKFGDGTTARPRFRLRGMLDEPYVDDNNVRHVYEDGSLAAMLDTIIAPQFAFTKSTLRECMQQVGGFIHGEPRITPKKDGAGAWYYEVDFDMYGGATFSNIFGRRSTKLEVKSSVSNYCSYIDSHAENLVNQLDVFSGVIAEPATSGYKTVRTEEAYARINESSMIIATQYPIYDVVDLEIGIIPDGGGVPGYVSIKPFVFEKSVYDTQLSSYLTRYPLSKAYGIYFTQGAPNIQGLMFKMPSETGNDGFKTNAIVNILRQVTGRNIDLSSSSYEYSKLAFRITYVPFYGTRILQSKAYYKDAPRLSGLIYNQQSNVVETRYYGENLKGAVARLGNVEKTVTYLLSNVSFIPKAGDLYDKDYYISAVLWELYPTCIKVQVGLSKNFNKLSEYIGISSVKRYSEVSLDQSTERNIIFREYIEIGDRVSNSDGNGAQLISDTLMMYFMGMFGNIYSGSRVVDMVSAVGVDYNGNEISGSRVALPVIASAFGNSMSFSWRYEDNYSAGARSEESTNPEIKGYFQNNVPYGDYYGRLWSYKFSLGRSALGTMQDSLTEQTSIGTALPSLPAGTTGIRERIVDTPVNSDGYIVRKDSREQLQVTVQVDLVTNDPDIIIGSALASGNRLVRSVPTSGNKPKVYFFDSPLSRFIDRLIPDATIPSREVSTPSSDRIAFYVPNDEPGKHYKAWAIISPAVVEEIDVEDEQGNRIVQRIQTGGEVLLAKNGDFEAGTSVKVYFTPRHEVFNTKCWADKR